LENNDAVPDVVHCMRPLVRDITHFHAKRSRARHGPFATGAGDAAEASVSIRNLRWGTSHSMCANGQRRGLQWLADVAHKTGALQGVSINLISTEERK